MALTYVDPRWSSRSKTAMDSTWPGSAEILYEWEHELPRGWEQHHDQEGKIYFTKSEDGLLTETWIDPRWQDSWDKFQRARQQNKMQIKRPQVILAQASPQIVVWERQTTCKEAEILYLRPPPSSYYWS
jgi:hypothetical protein